VQGRFFWVSPHPAPEPPSTGVPGGIAHFHPGTMDVEDVDGQKSAKTMRRFPKMVFPKIDICL